MILDVPILKHFRVVNDIIIERIAIILVLVESYMNCAVNIFVSFRLFIYIPK